MSLIGAIEQFKPGREDFESYVDRMKQFFICNVIEENMKVPLFITLIGPDTYSLLKNLCFPQKPEAQQFDDIVSVLMRHLSPKKLIIAERFAFYRAQQVEGQPLNEFIVEIRKLANSCEFGPFLEEALRDKFVCGITSESIQRKLLAMEKVTFSEACTLALAHELTEKQSKLLAQEAVHKVSDNKNQAKGTVGNKKEIKQSQREKVGHGSTGWRVRPCRRCGRRHDERNCPAVNWECFLCKKKGHIAKAKFCEGYANHTEEIVEYYTEEGVHSLKERDVSPLLVKIKIEDKWIEMEVDTGAASTIIPRWLFRKWFPSAVIKPDNRKLKSILGQVSDPVGVAMVNVCYGNESYKLKVTIPKAQEEVCLLGRGWMNILMPGWRNTLVREKRKSETAMESVGKVSVNSACADKFVESIKCQFAEVFTVSPGKGIKGHTAVINVKEGAIPKFSKPYRVPYALKSKVEAELNKLVVERVLEKVKMSNWASPIVVVPKSNGNIRICGDFKNTINPVVENEYYPLPTTEEVLVSIKDNSCFTVLDLKNAYLQLSINPECKEFLTINTPCGLFRYNKMPFGVKVAPLIFQRVIDDIISNLEGTVSYLDDVLICGKSEEDVMAKTIMVLQRFLEYGVTVNFEKCQFLKESIKFLGHVIEGQGIRPDEEKIQAILEAPRPINKKQLQSYLGLLHYYTKFIPNLASEVNELYKLLKNESDWDWSEDTEKCFQKSKQLLVSEKVLVPYNPEFPLVLTTDASPYGVGGVLSHVIDGVEKPIMYASSSLSKAEKNYSHLEKEALAIVFAINKFHRYIYGRKFVLYTDHKPLQTILSPKKNLPPLAAARIQNWAVKLSMYDYDVKYKPGSYISNADGLSRLPIRDEIEREVVKYFSVVRETPMNFSDVAFYTDKDTVLNKVKEYVKHGWPEKVDEGIKPYHNIREDINLDVGCLTFKNRVIIPAVLKEEVLSLLHEGHPGIVKMKAVARMYVYWNGINKEIEAKVRRCEGCQANNSKGLQTPITSWNWSTKKWQRLHLDFAEKYGHKFLLLVDAHSKWIDVWLMSSTKAEDVISCLRKSFAVFGLPEEIVSDNGPPFQSVEFLKFCYQQGIKVSKSPPFHPASNGAIERCVQTFKKALMKQVFDEDSKNNISSLQEKIDNFLFVYRNIPHAMTDTSPVEMLLKYKPRTRLTLLKPDVNKIAQAKQLKYIERKNENRKVYESYEVGENVMVKNVRNENYKFSLGRIMVKVSPVTYIVKVDSYFRHVHVDHLKKCAISNSQMKENQNFPVVVTQDNSIGKEDNSKMVCSNVITDNSVSNENCKPTEESMLTAESSVIVEESNQEVKKTRSGRIVKLPCRYRQ